MWKMPTKNKDLIAIDLIEANKIVEFEIQDTTNLVKEFIALLNKDECIKLGKALISTAQLMD